MKWICKSAIICDSHSVRDIICPSTNNKCYIIHSLFQHSNLTKKLWFLSNIELFHEMQKLGRVKQTELSMKYEEDSNLQYGIRPFISWLDECSNKINKNAEKQQNNFGFKTLNF